MLDMDQATLAAAALVSRNVIIDFEKGRRIPTRNNLQAIRQALEAAGVAFINGDAPGVKLKAKKARS
jgi:transcriptional regulator with XRE-family HTH domain